MNVLVIGNGGREHALCYGIKQSSNCKNLSCIPGSDAISEIANSININIDDHEAILKYCLESTIDLVVIGPELPLTKGLSNHLLSNSILVFGPDQMGAELEKSKKFTKDICKKLNIATAAYDVFDNYDDALTFCQKKFFPLVIKADGLAAGKGVIICETIDDAKDALIKCFKDNSFGDAGSVVVIEEFLVGEEVSLFSLVDKNGFVLPLTTAQDHKKILEEEKGLNTGGMGAYTPVPSISSNKMNALSKSFVEPIVQYLAEQGINYQGMFYAGLILTDKGPNLLEINVRFGDPETQAIIPLLETDLLELLHASATGTLNEIEKIKWKNDYAMTIVMAARGYPEDYKKLTSINNLENLSLTKDDYLFHAGTTLKKNKWLSNGGRVLNISSSGKDLKTIRQNIHKVINQINWDEGYYRKDIGWRYIDE
ncbi:MAG: phosphoribosylamine--glycine ligase [Alphaproteobacteria bacterium]